MRPNRCRNVVVWMKCKPAEVYHNSDREGRVSFFLDTGTKSILLKQYRCQNRCFFFFKKAQSSWQWEQIFLTATVVTQAQGVSYCCCLQSLNIQLLRAARPCVGILLREIQPHFRPFRFNVRCGQSHVECVQPPELSVTFSHIGSVYSQIFCVTAFLVIYLGKKRWISKKSLDT